ncbi:MAG: DNA/RNA non-specific endonuclease [Lachnospiraceae bacterium]|nr:DNA/RNA non-specific endonuclease [Lachnospiraceae bacterium]
MGKLEDDIKNKKKKTRFKSGRITFFAFILAFIALFLSSSQVRDAYYRLIGKTPPASSSAASSASSSATSGSTESGSSNAEYSGPVRLEDIPGYSGNYYVKLNDNKPSFNKEDMEKEAFESYSDLDDLGRCGPAYAKLGKELMPTSSREDISMIKPSGWRVYKYPDLIEDKLLYNRSHLIAFSLAGENANERNLITGTDYLNKEGMLPFEEGVRTYIRSTGNHVMYRVTPMYKGNELVARGLIMEAYSVEDDGKGICFNIFVYNVQPGVEIDYLTGKSKRAARSSAAA